MNIFILHENPILAAAAHCDQHIHKMILESAQLVSTAMYARGFNLPGLYKPAYPKHPCTLWTAESNHNILYVCTLALALEDVRQEVSNCSVHGSIPIIELVSDYLSDEFPTVSWWEHTPFTFAGPALIRMKKIPVYQQYQLYYRQKHTKWLAEKGVGMKYRGRQVPDFMADLLVP